jgi:hypothetical protein
VEKVTVEIPKTAAQHVCWLVEKLREIGQSVDTAQWGEVVKLDEEAVEYNEALADLFTAILVDNGLVEPLVTSEGS